MFVGIVPARIVFKKIMFKLRNYLSTLSEKLGRMKSMTEKSFLLTSKRIKLNSHLLKNLHSKL